MHDPALLHDVSVADSKERNKIRSRP